MTALRVNRLEERYGALRAVTTETQARLSSRATRHGEGPLAEKEATPSWVSCWSPAGGSSRP